MSFPMVYPTISPALSITGVSYRFRHGPLRVGPNPHRAEWANHTASSRLEERHLGAIDAIVKGSSASIPGLLDARAAAAVIGHPCGPDLLARYRREDTRSIRRRDRRLLARGYGWRMTCCRSNRIPSQSLDSTTKKACILNKDALGSAIRFTKFNLSGFYSCNNNFFCCYCPAPRSN